MEREALIARIEAGMSAGTVPCQDCLVTWFGEGRGHRCVVCEEPITSPDTEVECDLPGGGTVYFHNACFDLWHAALPA
jgi:hypothetical protein